MADIITMEQARLACRIDGEENDDFIQPLKTMAEKYITEAVGAEKAVKTDPRVVAAVQAHIRLAFRPNEDVQGNLRAHLTSLILQIKGG